MGQFCQFCSDILWIRGDTIHSSAHERSQPSMYMHLYTIADLVSSDQRQRRLLSYLKKLHVPAWKKKRQGEVAQEDGQRWRWNHSVLENNATWRNSPFMAITRSFSCRSSAILIRGTTSSKQNDHSHIHHMHHWFHPISDEKQTELWDTLSPSHSKWITDPFKYSLF